MSDREYRVIIEVPGVGKYEPQNVYAETRLSSVIISLYEHLRLPLDLHPVIELVDSNGSSPPTRLSANMTIREAGIEAGDVLRIHPQSATGMKLRVHKYLTGLRKTGVDAQSVESLQAEYDQFQKEFPGVVLNYEAYLFLRELLVSLEATTHDMHMYSVHYLFQTRAKLKESAGVLCITRG